MDQQHSERAAWQGFDVVITVVRAYGLPSMDFWNGLAVSARCGNTSSIGQQLLIDAPCRTLTCASPSCRPAERLVPFRQLCTAPRPCGRTPTPHMTSSLRSAGCRQAASWWLRCGGRQGRPALLPARAAACCSRDRPVLQVWDKELMTPDRCMGRASWTFAADLHAVPSGRLSLALPLEPPPAEGVPPPGAAGRLRAAMPALLRRLVPGQRRTLAEVQLGVAWERSAAEGPTAMLGPVRYRRHLSPTTGLLMRNVNADQSSDYYTYKVCKARLALLPQRLQRAVVQGRWMWGQPAGAVPLAASSGHMPLRRSGWYKSTMCLPAHAAPGTRSTARQRPCTGTQRCGRRCDHNTPRSTPRTWALRAQAS